MVATHFLFTRGSCPLGVFIIPQVVGFVKGFFNFFLKNLFGWLYRTPTNALGCVAYYPRPLTSLTLYHNLGDLSRGFLFFRFRSPELPQIGSGFHLPLAPIYYHITNQIAIWNVAQILPLGGGSVCANCWAPGQKPPMLGGNCLRSERPRLWSEDSLLRPVCAVQPQYHKLLYPSDSLPCCWWTERSHSRTLLQ